MHACAAITHQCRKPEDYCHGLLSLGSYHATYQFFVNPTNSQEFWEQTSYDKPVPPTIRRSAGRPKKQRRKDGNEDVVVGGKLKRSYKDWTCSRCNEQGHNSRGCPQRPVNEKEVEGQQGEGNGHQGQGQEQQQGNGQQGQGQEQHQGNGQQAEIPLSQSAPLNEHLSQEASVVIPDIPEGSTSRKKV